MTWPLARVGDLAEQIRGVTFAKGDTSPVPAAGLLPVMTATNVTELGLVNDSVLYLPRSKVGANQVLRKNDVLVTASSGSLSVVGRAVLVREELDATFGAFCKVLRPRDGVDPNYFAHFFRTSHYRSRVSRVAAGANINNLRNEDLDGFEIPLPPLPEQRRIASILDQAEDLRALRRTALKKLDDLQVATFRERFGLARDLPETTLNELIDPKRPLSYGILMPGPDVADGIPYIRVTDLSPQGVQLDKIRKTSPQIEAAFKRSRLKAGDLLLSIRGHVGRTALVPPEMEGANITQDTARIAVEGADAAYVKAWLDSPASQEWMRKHTKGVAVQGINLQDVRRIPVKLPPVAEQGTFGSILRQLQLDRARAQIHLDLLNATFESLQDLAFSNPA